MQNPPQHQVRALYDDETITVYQAYNSAIADAALAAGRFSSPFKIERMTWIKPSFMWMMYRSGWAQKPGQERVLAIRMSRTGFEEALSAACLADFQRDVHGDHAHWKELLRRKPVRVQWDPERSFDLAPLGWRSIQIGLGATVVRKYVREWAQEITDVTALARQIHSLVQARDLDQARALLPQERPYRLPEAIARDLDGSAW